MRVTAASGSAFILVGAGVALAVASGSPFAVAALGLMAFGALHIALELRYVIGRFGSVLRGPFLSWLVTLTAAIVIARGLTGVVGWTLRAEIVLGFGIVAVGCWYALTGGARIIGFALVIAGLVASLAWPAGYIVVLTHLHNLVPLAFLWDWSRRLAHGRGWFLAANLVWAVAIPLAILLGTIPITHIAPTWLAPLVGNGSGLIAAASPGLTGEPGLRYLTVFAFMQTMHYLIWIVFLPLAAPDATTSFDRLVPALRGWRIWALGLGIAAVLGMVFASHYPTGKALYSLIAACHVYIEFPLLIVLLVGSRHASRTGALSPIMGKLTH